MAYIDHFGYDSDRLVRCWHILDNNVTADFIAIKAKETNNNWDYTFKTLKFLYYNELSYMTSSEIVYIHLKYHLYAR